MRSRIGVQVIAGVGLVTTLTIGIMSAALLRAHRAQLIRELNRGADQLSETIKSSTYYDMLENRQDNLRRQVETIGRQQGIRKVRLFDKEGVIRYSSDAQEIGTSLDKNAEACYACHAAGQPLSKLPIQARARIFDEPDGSSEPRRGRVLGIINPIQNRESCSSATCHAHAPEASVLGVLDVHMSMAEVDREIAADQRRMVGLVALTLLASGLLLFWLTRRLVVLPARALLAGTGRVAEGDLTATVPVTATHELGQVAVAFNSMTRSLAEARRQLTQADKLASVGRLAAGVAHEINNPLTGVLTYASYLLDRAKDDPESKHDLEVVVRETERCRTIVRRLLDFARQTPPDRRPIDLNVVVRQAVSVVINQLTLNHVDLALDLAPELPPLQADANQLQQVAINLILNAADAAEHDGGKIRIASRRAELAAWGHAPIRHAKCAAGCDLTDPTTRIAGLNAIRVLRDCGGRESLIHLDPTYGRFNHIAAGDCAEGTVAAYACPQCHRSLAVPGSRCDLCGAPRFGVEVRGRGSVLWCTRSGCHGSRWDAEDARGSAPVVELAVEDSGRGIAPEDMRHLFEPFFTTKGTHGTGLGLAVSWGIVDGHGGTIDVSSAEGRGTRFTVRLPLSPAPELEPQEIRP